ncbi:MAG: hypothetical protein AAF772_04085 [Acidobacteriota bacterium]
MRRFSRLSLAFAAFVLALFLADSALAYVVFLKDGSQITTREKYRIEGDQAYLTLPSGTRTVLPASEIDIEKTEEVNSQNTLGQATLVEGLGRTSNQLPPPTPKRDDLRTLLTLQDDRDVLAPPEREIEEADPRDPDTIQVPQTPAGYNDLLQMSRETYGDQEIVDLVKEILLNQGLDDVEVNRGTRSGRIYLRVMTTSEGAVFRALEATSESLLQLRERFPRRAISAIELLMLTSASQRAGQFLITPDDAQRLMSKTVARERFFLRHVQF